VILSWLKEMFYAATKYQKIALHIENRYNIYIVMHNYFLNGISALMCFIHIRHCFESSSRL